jgi:hypothetical protein
MSLISEAEIRGYVRKDGGLICKVCASDEEKTALTEIKAEDEIHDEESMFCIRCKKKLAE